MSKSCCGCKRLDNNPCSVHSVENSGDGIPIVESPQIGNNAIIKGLTSNDASIIITDNGSSIDLAGGAALTSNIYNSDGTQTDPLRIDDLNNGAIQFKPGTGSFQISNQLGVPTGLNECAIILDNSNLSSSGFPGVALNKNLSISGLTDIFFLLGNVRGSGDECFFGNANNDVGKYYFGYCNETLGEIGLQATDIGGGSNINFKMNTITNNMILDANTINLQQTLPNDDTQQQLMVRNNVTGNIQYRHVNTIDNSDLENIGGFVEVLSNPGVAQTPYNFRTFQSSNGDLTITQNLDNIDIIAGSNPFITDIESVGGFSSLVQLDGVSSLHNFRTVQSSDNSITITQNADDVDFIVNSAISSATDIQNIGTGVELIDPIGIASLHNCRSLLSSDSTILFTQNANDIDLTTNSTISAYHDISNSGGFNEIIFVNGLQQVHSARTLQSSNSSLTITQNATNLDLIHNNSVTAATTINNIGGFNTLVTAATAGLNTSHNIKSVQSSDSSITITNNVNDLDIKTNLTGPFSTTINNDVTYVGIVEVTGNATTHTLKSLQSSDASITITDNGTNIDLKGTSLTFSEGFSLYLDAAITNPTVSVNRLPPPYVKTISGGAVDYGFNSGIMDQATGSVFFAISGIYFVSYVFGWENNNASTLTPDNVFINFKRVGGDNAIILSTQQSVVTNDQVFLSFSSVVSLGGGNFEFNYSYDLTGLSSRVILAGQYTNICMKRIA